MGTVAIYSVSDGTRVAEYNRQSDTDEIPKVVTDKFATLVKHKFDFEGAGYSEKKHCGQSDAAGDRHHHSCAATSKL